MNRLLLLIFAFLVTSFACISPNEKIEWYVSSELYPGNKIWFTNPPPQNEIRYRLSKQKPLNFQSGLPTESIPIIKIDPTISYQNLFGIGTSLEATSLYAIAKNKNDDQIKDLLRAIIDPVTGIGMNLFRITVGTSDFSDGRSVSSHPQGFYSYQDFQDAEFSIQRDVELGIIHVLQLAVQVANECGQDIRFFATCWSPPAWMKTSNALIGGTLKEGMASQLAVYFRRYIQAYEKNGIPIHAITVQNELNFVPDAYPGMKLTWQQERDIVIATFEEFQQAKISTKLWINDHNFEFWENADSLLVSLEEMGKKHFVDAVAFHAYSAAPPTLMTKLKKNHPTIDIQFTEMSKFGVKGMYDIQTYFWNWSRSYMYWVTMSTRKLDEHNQGPYNSLDMLSPTMFIEDDPASGTWFVTPEYNLLGQFSKFLHRGAVRLECDQGTPETVTALSFRNPDGKVVIILVNQTETPQKSLIEYKRKYVQTEIPHKSVATFIWND